MNRQNCVNTLAICGTILAAAAIVGRAGPLDPSAGPVAPTGKTVLEVEPRVALSAANTPGDADSLFRITQSGSYYLTQSYIVAPGRNGIEIAVPGVTIDLEGFTLAGFGGSLTGIVTTGTYSDITIRNGVVRTFGQAGIDLSAGGFGEGALIENVLVSDNLGNGIRGNLHSIVRSCVARGNGSNGITVPNGCIIDGCTALDNGNRGIDAGTSSVVRGCVARENTSTGIFASAGSIVQGCASADNTVHGINTASGATIIECAAYSNDSDGFIVSPGASVLDCTAKDNLVNGVQVTTGCMARGNTCDNNGGTTHPGIRTAGIGARIEGNTVSNSPLGFDVSSTHSNLLLYNSAIANTTAWNVNEDNVLGPGSGAFMGSMTGEPGQISNPQPFGNVNVDF